MESWRTALQWISNSDPSTVSALMMWLQGSDRQIGRPRFEPATTLLQRSCIRCRGINSPGAGLRFARRGRVADNGAVRVRHSRTIRSTDLCRWSGFGRLRSGACRFTDNPDFCLFRVDFSVSEGDCFPIRRKIRQSDRSVNVPADRAGEKLTDICRKPGVSQTAFYTWKKQYAGMGIVPE